MKVLKNEPEIILRNGKPAAVILKIEDYEELLERLEDAEDVKWLRATRTRPLKFRKFDDFLASVGARV
jgi:PHD/YefM family antitoxin component YafN of YafNO toxin-antitoxin module